VFSSRAATTGSPTQYLTAQCGVAKYTGTNVPDIESGQILTVYHSRVNLNSIIIAQPQTSIANLFVLNITPEDAKFKIVLSGIPPSNTEIPIGWFIVSF
jgi:hypothetical protein